MGMATLKTVSLRSKTPMSRPAPPLLPPPMMVMPYDRFIGIVRLPTPPMRPELPPEIEIPPGPLLTLLLPVRPLLPLLRPAVPLPEPVPLADVTPAPVAAMFPLPASTDGLLLVPDPLLIAPSAPLPLYGSETIALFFAGTASAYLPLLPTNDSRDGPTTKLPLSCASGIWTEGAGATFTAFTTMTAFRGVVCNSTTGLLTAGVCTAGLAGAAGSSATGCGTLTSLGIATVASGMGI